jgi:hypothetical protein
MKLHVYVKIKAEQNYTIKWWARIDSERYVITIVNCYMLVMSTLLCQKGRKEMISLSVTKIQRYTIDPNYRVTPD